LVIFLDNNNSKNSTYLITRKTRALPYSKKKKEKKKKEKREEKKKEWVNGKKWCRHDFHALCKFTATVTMSD